MLRVESLNKSFHGQPVLQDINFEVLAGELVAIIGRSGCGKSTLLRCLNQLEDRDSGSVGFTHLNFGMVFQSFNLFPHLTVIDNITLAPKLVRQHSLKTSEIDAKALLKKVGLSSHIHHYPSQLSGGQQQRAAIARALAMQPKIMLYDEPTSALDPWLVDEVFQVMKKLHEEGLTQLVVTHEMRFVREFATKIIYMEEGKIIEIGTPKDLLESPKDTRTAKYLKRFVS